MIELIKKAVLTGVGVASLTKDKVEDLVTEMSAKGKLSEQEGEKLLQEVLARVEESRQTVKEQTEGLIQETISKMQLARATDIEQLKLEVEKLREEITSLRGKGEEG